MNLPSLGFLAFIHQGRFVKEGLLPHAMEYRVHTVFKNLKLPATRNGNGEIDFEELKSKPAREVLFGPGSTTTNERNSEPEHCGGAYGIHDS